MTQEQVIDLMQWGNEAALTWYATAADKPIRSPSQTSLMGSMIGTDLGQAGPYQAPIAVGSGILILGIIVVAIVMMNRS